MIFRFGTALQSVAFLALFVLSVIVAFISCAVGTFIFTASAFRFLTDFEIPVALSLCSFALILACVSLFAISRRRYPDRISFRVAIGGVTTAILLTAGMSAHRAYQIASEWPKPSRDGQFYLLAGTRPRQNSQCASCVVLTVTSKSGETLWDYPTGASNVQRWDAEWDASNNIWLYSSDIGLYRFDRTPTSWSPPVAAHKRDTDSPQPPSELRGPGGRPI